MLFTIMSATKLFAKMVLKKETKKLHFFLSLLDKFGLLLCHSHIELRLRLRCVEVDIEAEVNLRQRLKWGWVEVESKFSWNWVEVELSWSWDKLTLNKGKNWAFIGVELWFKICFRSTYVAEQLLFSMLLFYLIKV